MSTSKARSAKKPGHGYLLDAWLPPRAAGESVGCAATSFTFDTVFFEEECLGRFLQMQTDSQTDGVAYLIEREEKLVKTPCLALVDQAHARGSHSLRWDMMPARVYQASLHAKVSLLVWTEHVRLIVASANLTEPGYRQNQEVFGVLDYHVDSESPLPVLREVLDFLAETATRTTHATAARERWLALVKQARQMASTWGVEDNTSVRAVLTGQHRRSAFAQLREDIWPMKRAPHFASVGSPFFDMNAGVNRPAKLLWDWLGSTQPEVWFEVTGKDVPGKKARLHVHAPQSLVQVTPPQGRHRLRRVPTEDEDGNARPFHAKWLWLENDSTVVYLIGSANFTSAGMGIAGVPNIEAGLAYLAKANDCAALKAAGLNSTVIDERKQPLVFEPVANDDEASDGGLLLPMSFGSAVYDGSHLRLSFGSSPPVDWVALGEDAKGQRIADDKAWRKAGSPETWPLPWTLQRPPSGLVVTWPGSAGEAWWPVTLTSAMALPPPEELRALSLDLLIEVLRSGRPAYEIIARSKRRKAKSKGDDGEEQQTLDPHKRVDTRDYLLPRARRVSWALEGLQTRLKQPFTSRDALDWRLHGPLGVRALADALAREAQSIAERVFLLTELMLMLGQVELPKDTPPGCLERRVVRVRLRAMQAELRAELEPLLNSKDLDAAMATYVRNACAQGEP